VRYEFLDEHAQKVKNFAQPLLDDQAILVAVHHMFFPSQEDYALLVATPPQNHVSLPQKIKTVFEHSMHLHCTASHIPDINKKHPHSFSGHVIAAGAKVTTLRPGDTIACIGIHGLVNTDLTCISEYDAVLVSNPANIKETSITGFALLAMHAVVRAKLQVGYIICIIGFDALSYLIMQLAKLSGATVIVLDSSSTCLLDAQRAGAHYCYNSSEAGWLEEILCITQRHGVDITFAAKNNMVGITLDAAISITRPHGRIVVVGLNNIHIDHAVLGTKDIDFVIAALRDACYHEELYRKRTVVPPFIKWRQRTTMQQIVRLIEHKKLHVEQLMEHQISNNNLSHAAASTMHETAMGFLVSFAPNSRETSQSPDSINMPKQQETTISPTRFVPAVRDTIRVGIVGADTFVKNTLMPLLSQVHNVTVHAIADVEQTRAERVSHLYNVAKTCIVDSEFLQGDAVDAVIIASNNMFHTDYVIRALEHNKAVFVKEPLAATFEQFKRLTSILHNRADAPLCLDYYRSYAPFIRKIKHVVQKRSTPLMARYRVNTCTVLQCTKQEDTIAGNIVSDACHFIDIFCYLTDAHPVAVSVETVHSTRDDLFPTDNFSAQISFNDGSVCSLLYTSLGHDHFGGEHLEVFFDAKAIVMQDFATLNGYGLPAWFDEVASPVDKGREHIINDFFTGLCENPVRLSMSRERILTVSHLSLIIDHLACAGGGARQLQEHKANL
jgi:predicted dehydrogenase/threonine dehydrogenase-like Zn-dependent dehydrogenase